MVIGHHVACGVDDPLVLGTALREDPRALGVVTQRLAKVLPVDAVARHDVADVLHQRGDGVGRAVRRGGSRDRQCGLATCSVDSLATLRRVTDASPEVHLLWKFTPNFRT
jgi:hypothetical protein